MDYLIEALIVFMVGLALIIAALTPRYADGRELHLFELQELSIDYKNYEVVNPVARNLLIYPEHPKEGINVNIKTDVLKYIYWNSTVESLTTNAKYEAIGLETRLGLYLHNNLQLGFWHHSQHTLDRAPATLPKFPSEDSVELRIFLYRRESGKGIF